MFVHVLYIHAHEIIDGRDNAHQSCGVIKEYHFYVSDDDENDILFIQKFFGFIYYSFRRRGVSFTEHQIWLYGCAGYLKSAHYFYS